ncbi:hypothetical protein AAP_03991 [Ascosphaera apis ARSEF 7405]|uniref:WD-like domain-containing protein n=1 Tax=Ascosphaera apis ARSEF 7405 TaxID=392613 RepID=A0A167XFY8_9EURO|nr:hypothetical protein AAP_03991 [Ascosphaera apis ARSEF 7405]
MLLCRCLRDVIVHSIFVVLIILPCLDVAQSADAYNYTFALRELANGTMPQNASTTPGAMWLNVRGYSPDELPYIQNNLGVHSLDAYDEMRMVAALAIMAAKFQRYGDLVYLYSLFEMNAAFGSSGVDKPAMRDALWKGATGCPLNGDCGNILTSNDGTGSDSGSSSYLLDLYASTSTSAMLSRVYEEFKGSNSTSRTPTQRQHGPVDDYNTTISHAASLMTCSGLLTLLKDGRMSPRYGGPRSVCYSNCCLSWTGNAVFQWADVMPDIQQYCLDEPTPGTTLRETEVKPSQAGKGAQDKSRLTVSKRSTTTTHQVSCRLQSMIADGEQFNICMGNRAMSCS